VVHTAAALPLWDDRRIRETTIDGTRNVLWAAKEEAVDRVVYVSSTAVYGTHDSHPITEESPLDGVGAYGEAKIEAEKICADFRRMGECVSVLRPKTFIGPQRLGVFQVLFDWIESGANVPMVGWGNNKYQLMHVYDLVRSMEFMFARDEADVNTVFNVGADEFGTMKEDFQAPINYAGTGKRTIGTPTPLTVFALRVLEKLNLSPLVPVGLRDRPRGFVRLGREAAIARLGAQLLEQGGTGRDLRVVSRQLRGARTRGRRHGIGPPGCVGPGCARTGEGRVQAYLKNRVPKSGHKRQYTTLFRVVPQKSYK
jgi:Nucleoside-diphosphate-sugar epimerases